MDLLTWGLIEKMKEALTTLTTTEILQECQTQIRTPKQHKK